LLSSNENIRRNVIGDIQLSSQRPELLEDGLQEGHLMLGLFERRARSGVSSDADRLRSLLCLGQPLEELLCHVGHEWMQNLHSVVKAEEKGVKRCFLGFLVIALHNRLDSFDVIRSQVFLPVLLEGKHALSELVLFHVFVDSDDQFVQLGEHPLVEKTQLKPLKVLFRLEAFLEVSKGELDDVPQLVAELAEENHLLQVQVDA